MPERLFMQFAGAKPERNARPPRGASDEAVLALYQAALAEYALKAVGIVNRTPGLT